MVKTLSFNGKGYEVVRLPGAHWGIWYWSNTKEFCDYVRAHG